MKHIKDSVTVSELAGFIKNAVEELIFDDIGCHTFKLDDKLAVCVGWSSGFGEKKRDDIIQSMQDPDYAIMAGIKDYKSDGSMLTDYDWIDYPIVNEENYRIDASISPNENYFRLAKLFIDEYNTIVEANKHSHELHDSEKGINSMRRRFRLRDEDSYVKDISSRHVHKAHDSEDLGWISTPELLEEDDFVDREAFEFWVKTLGEIAHARSEARMKNIAKDAMNYLYDDDFKNLDVRDEIRDDLRKVIWGDVNQHLLGRRIGDSKKNIKDTDWDFIHQIKSFKYDDIETAMFELFPKKFIKENFTDEWGDPDFSAMRLATFLDKVKKAKLLKYLNGK